MSHCRAVVAGQFTGASERRKWKNVGNDKFNVSVAMSRASNRPFIDYVAVEATLGGNRGDFITAYCCK